jgi:glycosyltransferase involved in cell wall biosynthesis
VKILHVVHQFLPHHHHGAEVSTYELARLQQAKGHEVVVVAGENGHYGKELHLERDRYREIDVVRFFFNPRSVNGWLQHAGFAGRWRRLLEDERPDIIHFQLLLNLSLSMIDVTSEMNIPMVFTLRDFSPLCQRITLVRGNGDLCRQTNLESDCLQCLSQNKSITGGERIRASVDLVRENISNPRSWRMLIDMVIAKVRSQRTAPPVQLASTSDLKKRNAAVIDRLHKVNRITAISEDTAKRFEALSGNQVTVQAIQQVPDTSRCEWKLRKNTDDPIRFGYIGKIRFEKGVQLLLKAFRQLPNGNAKLLIFGGPTRTDVMQLAFWRELKQLADWPGVSLHPDRFDPDQIATVLAQFDVLVIPSIWFEAYGRVVAEALASGIPVICSDEGGPASIIEPDVNGLTFPIGNESALKNVLQRFLDEPELLESLSAETRVPKTTDQYVDEIFTLYEDVIINNG